MDKPSFFKRVTNSLRKTRSKQRLSSVEEELGLPPLEVSLTAVRTCLYLRLHSGIDRTFSHAFLDFSQ